jgi:predicted transcriptional regulator
MAEFFRIFRKKGFGETLRILNKFKNKETTQTEFYKTLRKTKSVLNSFFRVKGDLIKNRLISYKLNLNNEKVIYLTEKGREMLEMVGKIESLVQKPDDIQN